MRRLVIVSMLLLSACATDWQKVDFSSLQGHPSMKQQANPVAAQPAAQQDTARDNACFKDCVGYGYKRGMCEKQCSY